MNHHAAWSCHHTYSFTGDYRDLFISIGWQKYLLYYCTIHLYHVFSVRLSQKIILTVSGYGMDHAPSPDLQLVYIFEKDHLEPLKQELMVCKTVLYLINCSLKDVQGIFVVLCCRDFIEQHYVNLKQANPKFPILIRECSGVQPVVWARYGQYVNC